MKVVMLNGSPRKNGNTGILLKEVEKALNNEGIETEIIQIAGKKFHGCTACMRCFENEDSKCVFDDDFVNKCIEKMVDADGIIIGSPTYFADVTADTKALIDRAGFVGIANGSLFRRKVGAAVVAVRRAGAVHAYDTINHFFGISSMFTVGSSYWNIGTGLAEGDVLKDEEGLLTMQELGKNMAWILKKINSDGEEEEKI